MHFLSLLLFSATAYFLIKATYWLRLKKIKLKPNCLLTRHPIVVICNPRPAIQLIQWSITTADFLQEHGYNIFSINLKAKSDHKSTHQLKTEMAIASHNFTHFHLMYGPEHKNILNEVRPLYLSAILTEVLLTKQTHEEALNSAISLAEKDFQCSH